MNIFEKTSLRRKLIIVFVILIVVNILICVYYLINVNKSINANQLAYSSYMHIWEISNTLKTAEDQLEFYIRSGEPSFLNNYTENRDIVVNLISELKVTTSNVEESIMMRVIKNSTDSLFSYYDLAAKEYQNGAPMYYINYYEGNLIISYIYDYLDYYVNLLLEEHTASVNEIELQTKKSFINSQIFLFSFVIIYIAIAFIFSRWITKPISNLVQAAKKISHGDYEFEELPITNHDELGDLTMTFNIMKEDISNAIDFLKERVEFEKQLREAELKEIKNTELLKEAKYLALQSQMNPHFLFNTLNAISRSIEYLPKEVSINLVHSLANIYRYNLDHFNTYSTIEEELYVTSSYIFIQQHRFEERIQYNVKCDEDCKEVLVPSLILQPLVENALKHGIENMEDGGKIFVGICRKKQGVCIRVFDTGVGIDKPRLESIEKHIKGESPLQTTGIGLSNIAQRISLIEHSTMKIKSNKKFGTLIKIYLPFQ